MNQFIVGFNHLAGGFRLIAKPGLRRYVVIPFLLNVSVFILFFMLLRHYVMEFNVWFEHFLPAWLHWLSAILWLLFFIGFFLGFIYAFLVVGNIVCAPFNSLLAQRVQYELSGIKLPDSGLLGGIKDAPRNIARQLGIVCYYLPRALILFILFFIPVIQVAAPLFWFAFNAWHLALTYIDYPSDNNKVSLRDTRTWMAGRRMESLGMGTAILLASMVPVVNFVAIPASVAAATICWAKRKG